MNIFWKSYQNSLAVNIEISESITLLGLIIGQEMILIKLEEEDTIYIHFP